MPVGSTVVFAEALGAVGVRRRDAVYWAGRTTLVRRPEDVELYDRGFAAWWEHGARRVDRVATTDARSTLAFDADGDDDAPSRRRRREPSDAPTLAVRYSRAEVLRQRDFAHYSPTSSPRRAG